ncbi:MAG TPA: porphobilinogen synthase [Bacillota bacterium]|nr:porphobilinogen synthase [Bacillota bacterium]HOL09720.1 porphobilinogen synthase [Bacillota bacterium]HPO97309.1 porphobilinogen synthase [Bacillota bacterium]
MSLNTRLRRIRQTQSIRELFQENDWNYKDLIMPFFVVEGTGIKETIPSLPGIYRYSIDCLLKELEQPFYQEIGGILLFGVPSVKDLQGTAAWSKEGIIQQACRQIKSQFPELVIITDLCLCSYTTHGHCGIVTGDGKVDNDQTLELLGRIALAQAEAGSDIIAPSDMMDGRVAKIRTELDQGGFADRLILSYAAKFASSFYGPFREAADSTPQFGDRRSYQLPPANRREALREMAADVNEGADIIMVKPGLPYLDILREARDQFKLPLAVYNVSGEYAMVKAAAINGWINEEQVVCEIMTGFKRAGADLIITYHAKDLYNWRNQ